MPQRILVTGGAGYIGSHTVVELVSAGFEVVILDNLCNSSAAVLPRLERICGCELPFVQADVRDDAALARVLDEFRIDGVIHFAALKAVGESVEKPLAYYENNIAGLLTLLAALQNAGVRNFVFSSSATVYGDPHAVPIREDFPLQVTNPYGRTKLMSEDILRDLMQADPSWRVAILRYFNPIGAHESGMIGESPNGIPNNLMPYVTQVAVGKRPHLSIFGNDWPTVDGTGVRDYIHVCDLARGHVAALQYLHDEQQSLTVNLGTGQGTSVRQLVDAFAEATGVPVPHQYAPRRPGDIAACYADPSLAERLMKWKAQRNIVDMCRDSWRWQSLNPEGFDTPQR